MNDNLDLTLVAGKAVAAADALRDGRSDPVKTISELYRLTEELNVMAKVHRNPSIGEREIHFATGFLLQATERWARYRQYEHEQNRAEDWRDATFAFVALVKNAVAREQGRAA